MKETMDKGKISKDSIIDIISSEGFTGLSNDMQEKVLNSIDTGKGNEGGLMGKFFGNKKENASMNIALIICLLLAIIGSISMWCDHECWDVIIPAIMTSVGYMFGVGVKSN